MTKSDVVEKLKSMRCNYATIVVDVCSDGEVIYPKEKVIISVLETQNTEDFIGKAYCVFDSIRDFVISSVFGREEARKYYCRYYFGNIYGIETY